MSGLRDIIQVAGVIDRAEAELLVSCGADWLGLPLRLPVHREDLDDAAAAALVAWLRGRAEAVLITYLADAAEIAALANRLGVSWVQLHGAIESSELERLRAVAPHLRILKSLVVRDGDAEELLEQVRVLASGVDAFITDTFDPETGASGATGKTHDWRVSASLVARSPRPVILAGGLTPKNVRDAIVKVRPAGVDVHTGVEGPDGRKRRDLVERFVSEARAGFASFRQTARLSPARGAR